MATTDFRIFTDETLLDFRDVFSLFVSVADVTEEGCFHTEELTGGRYLVTHNNDRQQKLLLTEQARPAFLRYMQAEHMDEMDAESYLGFNLACERDD
jgi:hypothetical protein